MGLARVGGKGVGSLQSKGSWRPGWQAPGVTGPQGDRPPGGLRRGGQRAKRAERESFLLRAYIVGGMGIKMLHVDWWVNVVPAFPGGMWLPKHRCVCVGGGLWARILAPIPLVHLVKQTHDRRQLVKVGTVTQSYLWASLGTVDPLPHSRFWDESTVSRLFFPR